MRFALKLGYRIDVTEGYSFDRYEGGFDGYVDHFFELKKSSTDPANRLIHKLLLNSFYGRWGMMENPVESKLVSWDEYDRLSKVHAIKNTAVVNEDSPENNVIVEFDKKPDLEICDNDR